MMEALSHIEYSEDPIENYSVQEQTSLGVTEPWGVKP